MAGRRTDGATRLLDGQHNTLQQLQIAGHRQTAYLPDSAPGRLRHDGVAVLAVCALDSCDGLPRPWTLGRGLPKSSIQKQVDTRSGLNLAEFDDVGIWTGGGLPFRGLTGRNDRQYRYLRKKDKSHGGRVEYEVEDTVHQYREDSARNPQSQIPEQPIPHPQGALGGPKKNNEKNESDGSAW